MPQVDKAIFLSIVFWIFVIYSVGYLFLNTTFLYGFFTSLKLQSKRLLNTYGAAAPLIKQMRSFNLNFGPQHPSAHSVSCLPNPATQGVECKDLVKALCLVEKLVSCFLAFFLRLKHLFNTPVKVLACSALPLALLYSVSYSSFTVEVENFSISAESTYFLFALLAVFPMLFNTVFCFFSNTLSKASRLWVYAAHILSSSFLLVSGAASFNLFRLISSFTPIVDDKARTIVFDNNLWKIVWNPSELERQDTIANLISIFSQKYPEREALFQKNTNLLFEAWTSSGVDKVNALLADLSTQPLPTLEVSKQTWGEFFYGLYTVSNDWAKEHPLIFVGVTTCFALAASFSYTSWSVSALTAKVVPFLKAVSPLLSAMYGDLTTRTDAVFCLIHELFSSVGHLQHTLIDFAFERGKLSREVSQGLESHSNQIKFLHENVFSLISKYANLCGGLGRTLTDQSSQIQNLNVGFRKGAEFVMAGFKLIGQYLSSRR